MNFEYNEKTQALLEKLKAFMKEEVYPIEKEYIHAVENGSANNGEGRWKTPEMMHTLKKRAKEAGLWNLFLPEEYKPYGAGLTNAEYAPLCEEMGRVLFSSEIFNCSAPDTGNMEVLAKYGNESQKKQWFIRFLRCFS